MQQKTQNKIMIVFGIVFVLSFFGIRLAQFFWSDANINLNGNKLNVLIARNSEQQYKGLSDRDNLGEYDGMMFTYPNAFMIGVVMRDMRFPIDVIWFYEGKVVDIAPNLQPELGVKEGDLRVYFPRHKADIFLELSAGWAEEHNLKLGDKLTILE